MRRAGRGRIVNIGSMGGRMTFPVGGYYHATKYAVEAISDALRNEVRGRSASTSSSSSPASPGPASRTPCTPRWPTALRHKMIRRMPRCWPATRPAPPRATATSLLGRPRERRPGRLGSGRRHEPRAAATSLTPAARAMIGARTLGGDRVWDASSSGSSRAGPRWSPRSRRSRRPSTPSRPCGASPSCSSARAPAPTGSRPSATRSRR